MNNTRSSQILATVAVLCLCVLLGCRDSAMRQSGPLAPVAGADDKAEEAQGPHYAGLIEEYRRVLSEDPSNLAALIGLGNAYYDSGNWRKAAEVYERALARDPHNADLRTDMGTAYRNMGMTERAIVEYHLALEHQPGHLNARYNLGVVYAHDRKDFPAAIRAWEEILKMAPNSPQAEQIRSSITVMKKRLLKEAR